MADGGGDDDGGSAEWLPIIDRVEAMVSEIQSQAEALAADRARLAAADWVQRESWEAAMRLQRSVEKLQAEARQKDAEMDRLREEASDARKKLQADAGWKMRWEVAFVELILGANEKLAELRDRDFEDSRTCAETSNSKEIGRRARLSQNTADQAQIATDISLELRKLKQVYETLRLNKEKEVSGLLSEKDSLSNRLSIMQQDYAALLETRKVEVARTTEAAQKLKENVDELKVLAQKKDGEIVRLRAEAVGAQKKLQKMQSLLSEKDNKIKGLKGRHYESFQKHGKDFSETHKESRSGDLAVTTREQENNDLRKTVEEDYISETKTMENNCQDETTEMCHRASSISNDDEMSGCDEDDDKQIRNDEDGDKQSGSDEYGDEKSRNDEDGDEKSRSDEDGDERSRGGDEDDAQSRSDVHDEDEHKQSGSGEETTNSPIQKPPGNPKRDDAQSRSDVHDEDEHKQSGSGEETTNSPIQKPPGNPKRKRDACNAETANSKRHIESNGVDNWGWSYVPPRPLRCRRLVFSQGWSSMIPTGNWAQFVSDVKDSLAGKPDKRKGFDRFLQELKEGSLFRYNARFMKHVLDGHPELIHRLNEFLPNDWQI